MQKYVKGQLTYSFTMVWCIEIENSLNASWPSKTTNGQGNDHFWGSTNRGHIRFVPFRYCYFPKIYHSWEEGASIPFVYIQITHPSHSSLYSVFVQHFRRPWLLRLVGEQNRPTSKDNPCSNFFGVNLVLFPKGEGVFSRGAWVF